MSEKEEIEIAVIPKGSKVQIMGCSYTLIEDVKVGGNQSRLDYVLKAQEDYDNGVGRVSYPKSKTTLSGKTGGAIGGSKNTGWML